MTKKFNVLGEEVEILISSKDTNGSFCLLTQISPPGGGPPPHIHANEDEFFTVLEGEYEIFDGKEWRPVNKGETAYTLRGNVHTFRNRGNTVGKMQAMCIPGGLDVYLEQLSALSMPPVMEQVVGISDPYGIRFIAPEQPVESAPL